MKIETIVEKGSNRLNEDNLVVEDNLFEVFDGATSLDKAFFEKAFQKRAGIEID